MGWAEKLNPRSTWYRKRHPITLPYGKDELEHPLVSIPSGELIPRENRLIEFIKNIFKKKEKQNG